MILYCLPVDKETKERQITLMRLMMKQNNPTMNFLVNFSTLLIGFKSALHVYILNQKQIKNDNKIENTKDTYPTVIRCKNNKKEIKGKSQNRQKHSPKWN